MFLDKEGVTKLTQNRRILPSLSSVCYPLHIPILGPLFASQVGSFPAIVEFPN